MWDFTRKQCSGAPKITKVSSRLNEGFHHTTWDTQHFKAEKISGSPFITFQFPSSCSRSFWGYPFLTGLSDGVHEHSPCAIFQTFGAALGLFLARGKKELQQELGCGFKDVLFLPLPGEMIQFESYFSNGLKPPTRKNQLLKVKHVVSWWNFWWCSWFVSVYPWLPQWTFCFRTWCCWDFGNPRMDQTKLSKVIVMTWFELYTPEN